MSDYRIADPRSRFLIVLITLIGVPLTGAGVDIYVPSLPAITHYFMIPNSLAQLSLTIYLIGYGLFTLVAGPLADRFGRRPLLMVSMALATVFSVMAACSSDIDTLLLSRFLQGIAISGLGVVVRALLPDTYQGKTLKRMLPFLMTSWAIGPILAPFIGAHLQSWFGWQASFYFLAGYSFLIFLLSFILPETLHNRHEFTLKVIKTNYLNIIKSRIFLGWTFMAVIFYAYLVVFSVIGPFIVEKVMHHSPVFYGGIALAMGVVWFMGSLTARFLTRFHPLNLLPTLCISSIVLAIGVLVYALSAQLTIFNLVVPTLLLEFIGALIFSICYSGSLSLFPKMGGSNSAASGAILSLGVGIVSSLAVILKTNSDIPLFIVFSVFFTVSTLIYFLVVKSPLIKSRQSYD